MGVDVEAPDCHLAAGLDDQAGEDVDERGLAGAIRPKQPEDLPARHVEAHIFERALSACIGLRQGFNADRWLVHSAWRNRRGPPGRDRKSTSLNSSHANISYAVFCLKKKR